VNTGDPAYGGAGLSCLTGIEGEADNYLPLLGKKILCLEIGIKKCCFF
jgi:hypothetical protein